MKNKMKKTKKINFRRKKHTREKRNVEKDGNVGGENGAPTPNGWLTNMEKKRVSAWGRHTPDAHLRAYLFQFSLALIPDMMLMG